MIRTRCLEISETLKKKHVTCLKKINQNRFENMMLIENQRYIWKILSTFGVISLGCLFINNYFRKRKAQVSFNFAGARKLDQIMNQGHQTGSKTQPANGNYRSDNFWRQVDHVGLLAIHFTNGNRQLELNLRERK